MKIIFSAQNISKRFNQRQVLQRVSFELSNGDVLAITGNNGTGKTTLLKILAGLSRANTGSVMLCINTQTIPPERIPQSVGFVAPYLELYKEFTPSELLALTASIRGISWDKQKKSALLASVGLVHRADDCIRGFSSGMQQRVRYALALQHHPSVLLFDEPTSNLDQKGIIMVYSLIQKFSKQGGIVVIATNDDRDVELCNHVVNVEEKNGHSVSNAR